MSEWRDFAMCTDSPGPWDGDAEDWTPERADAVCYGCPVREACLAAAIVEESGLPVVSRQGVRGGISPSGRARLDPDCADFLARRKSAQRRHDQKKAALGLRAKPCPTCGERRTNMSRHLRTHNREVAA